jgi:hypothetical protein
LIKYPHLDLDDPIAQIIQEHFSLECSSLSVHEKQEFYQLLLTNMNAFSLYGELGDCDKFEINIHLTDNSPFFIRPFPIAEEDKVIIDKEFTKLVRLGILKKGVNSAYCFPVMILSKRGTSEKRTVSYFRYLNSRISQVNQNYISLQTILGKLGQSECDTFSVIDLNSAFHSL